MAINGDRYKRGSLPPFVGFGDAVSFAEKIYENGGGRASYDLLSRIFDNSIKSSSFTKKLAALRAYGIVIEPSKGEVLLSDTGMAIAAPQSPGASENAKKEAFLKIEPFSRIYERHKGKLLPADEFIKNIFEQDSGIPKELSDSWVYSFKEAIRVAGLLYDRGDQKIQILESPDVARPASQAPMKQADQSRTIDHSHSADAYVQAPEKNADSGLNLKIRLSNGRFATFAIPDHLATSDIQKVKNALDGFKSWIDSLVADGN